MSSASNQVSPVGGQLERQDSIASRHEPGNSARLPAVIAHLSAICRAREHRGVTADVQHPEPGQYKVIVSNGRREVTLTLAWRRRRWDLTDLALTEDGEPRDAARTLYEVIRLLSDREAGTDPPSGTSGRLPRNSALEARKNTVLRI
jgi:hypothetical protein